MATSRQAAVKAMMRFDSTGAYSNILLDSVIEQSGLSELDSSFLAALLYTCVEHLITIDYNLSQKLRQPLSRLKPEVLAVLRCGAAQILFMDKVPDRAAVNESVQLVKKLGCAYASGLVNAVLRKISAQGLILPDSDKNYIEYLSVKYSVAPWIAELWVNSFSPAQAEKILASSFNRGYTDIRVNTLKTDAPSLCEMFSQAGFEVSANGLDDSLRIKDMGAPEKTPEFKKGLFHVQDKASQLCCRVLDAKPGDRVLDFCAAPGGKSFTLAQMMNNTGQILSMDIYPQRLRLIEKGAKRLGINIIETKLNDARVYSEELGKADKILCDVPCSGLGVIAKKPDIRYKKKSDVDKLPIIQYNILTAASKTLKENGRLVYSTCTLNPSENDDVCKRFLSEHKNFAAVSPDVGDDQCMPCETGRTLLPHIFSSDGFYIAEFVRTE